MYILKYLSKKHSVFLKRCDANSSGQINTVYQHRRDVCCVLRKKDPSIGKGITFSFYAIVVLTLGLI